MLDTPRNQAIIRLAAGLAEAAMEGTVLEARAVLCDAEHNLHVEMPCMEGVIPYFEGAIGIAEGTTPGHRADLPGQQTGLFHCQRI